MQHSGFRRLAAHYICLDRVYRMHYLVLDRDHRLRGIFPLTEELAATAFYSGILWVLPEGAAPERIGRLLSGWRATFPGWSLPDRSEKKISVEKGAGPVAGCGLKSCLDARAAAGTPGSLFPDLSEKEKLLLAGIDTLCVPAVAGREGDESLLPVELYWQRRLDFPSSEFGADHSGSDSYIQRL